MEQAPNYDVSILAHHIFWNFVVVFNLANEPVKSSIRMTLKRGLLKIKLRRLSEPDISRISMPILGHRRYPLETFLLLLSAQKIQRIKISSKDFDYRHWPSLNFLTNLLLNVRSNVELKLVLKEENSESIEQFNVMLSAALHTPERLRKVSLNIGFCNIPQREFVQILRTAVAGAENLKKLKLTTFRENLSVAVIMEKIIDGRENLALKLESLVLVCKKFDNNETLERIFRFFKNLKCLKIVAGEIDINNRTVQIMIENEELRENLETLYLSLRNKKISNDCLKEFFKVWFSKLEGLQIDLQGSNIDNSAFESLLKNRFQKLPKLKTFKLDEKYSKVTENFAKFLEYLVSSKLQVCAQERESSNRILINTLK